jgi:hypothetical protein
MPPSSGYIDASRILCAREDVVAAGEGGGVGKLLQDVAFEASGVGGGVPGS